MKQIYIAGPMTGYEYFNFQEFDKWRDYYEALGYNVFSPADHDRSLLNKTLEWMPTEEDSVGPWKSWAPEATQGKLPTLRDMLGADLQWIAKTADSIHMMKGWENSRGANAEWALAKALDLEIRYG
jgi:hypothetical protein